MDQTHLILDNILVNIKNLESNKKLDVTVTAKKVIVRFLLKNLESNKSADVVGSSV